LAVGSLLPVIASARLARNQKPTERKSAGRKNTRGQIWFVWFCFGLVPLPPEGDGISLPRVFQQLRTRVFGQETWGMGPRPPADPTGRAVCTHAGRRRGAARGFLSSRGERGNTPSEPRFGRERRTAAGRTGLPGSGSHPPAPGGPQNPGPRPSSPPPPRSEKRLDGWVK